MVDRLGITLINALTPQAKGRVERAHQTLQDRLIKDMRLSNINSIEQAKAFLPRFVISYNEKFAVPPHDEIPAHRPWTKPTDDLDLALASQDERVLSKSLIFSYGGTKYCLKTQGPGTSMRGGKVMVHQFAEGRLRFSYKERALTCTAYGTYAMPDPAEDEKTLDVRVAAIIAAQRTSQGVAGLAAG